MSNRQADIEARRRLATMLRQYSAREKISLDELAARLGLSRSSVYSMAGSNHKNGPPIAAALPRGDVLATIGRVLGCSIDWLLGFDVPPEREQRQAVGALADMLRRELEEGTPDPSPFWDDWSERIDEQYSVTRYPKPDSAFVAEVVNAYWTYRRQRNGSAVAPAFHALARRMRKDAAWLNKVNSDDDFDISRFDYMRDLEEAARNASAYAYLLDSKNVDWQDILDLTPRPLAIRYHGNEPAFWSTFCVAGADRRIGYGTLITTFVERPYPLPVIYYVDFRTMEPRVSAGDGLITEDRPPLAWGLKPEGYWATIDKWADAPEDLPGFAAHSTRDFRDDECPFDLQYSRATSSRTPR